MRPLTVITIVAILVFTGYYASQSPDTRLMFERFFTPSGNQTTLPPQQVFVSILAAPASAQEGKMFEVDWRVKSPQGLTTNDTRMFYDSISHPGTFSIKISPESSGYTGFTSIQTGSVPADFSANVESLQESNHTYIRAYCMVDGIGYWSSEESVATEAGNETHVLLTSAPSEVAGESAYTVNWKVRSPASSVIDSTFIEWGIETGNYTRSTETQSGIGTQEFYISLIAPSSDDIIYLRVKAVVDGIEYVSGEKIILVS